MDVNEQAYKGIYNFMQEGVLAVVAVSNDFLSLPKGSVDKDALNILANKLQELDYFDSFAFYEIENLIEFKQTHCYPNTLNKEIDLDVQEHIKKGTFSWALNNVKATLFTGPVSGNNQVLFSLSTKRRIHGMFIANAKNKGEISGVLLDVLQLILSITIFSIDSLHLTEQLTNYAQDLEVKVGQRTRELESAMIRVDQSNKTRSEFLANMSHEIRTPMNGVLGMLTLLQGTSLDDKQRQYISLAENTGNNMLALLNDVLDLSNVESGNLIVKNSSFNILETIDDLVSLFILDYADKGIELIVNIAPSIPNFIIGDEHHFHQLIMNLLDNAKKFTQKGEVYLNLSAKEIDETMIEIKVSVKDTGIGIAEESLTKIFNSFEQADVNVSRKFGGTGLGLTLCERITSMMQGDIHVESTLNQGSDFSFSVKMKKDTKNHSLFKFERGNIKTLYLTKETKTLEAIGSVFDYLDIKNTVLSSYDEIIVDTVATENGHFPTAVFVDEDFFSTTNISIDDVKNKYIRTSVDICVVCNIRNVSLYSDFFPVVIKPLQASKCFNYLSRLFSIKMDRSMKTDKTNLLVKKILVVEDNAVNQMVARGMLEKIGCDVTVAENGQIGLDMLLETKFDLVFMDINMPVLNGIDATVQYRNIEAESEHLPIIALTANVLPDDIKAYYKVGMDACISKPYTIMQLQSAIDELVRSEEAIDKEEMESELLTIDVVKVNSLKTMMGDVYSELLNTFVTRSSTLIKDIRSNYDDYETLVRDMHSLKGSSGSMGAIKLFSLCEEMELLLRKGVDEDRESKLDTISSELKKVQNYLLNDIK